MTETITGALIGAGGTLVGAIIAGPIAYFCSKQLISQSHEKTLEVVCITEFHKASAKIRASFAPAQAKLCLSKRTGEHNLKEFFDNEILIHASAIEQFRPFVSNSAAYQKAWEDYQRPIYDNDALGDADLRWWSGMAITEECVDEPANFPWVNPRLCRGTTTV